MTSEKFWMKATKKKLHVSHYNMLKLHESHYNILKLKPNWYGFWHLPFPLRAFQKVVLK